MKIFCSGIGGIGLSAYAALQRNNGHIVCGSDRSLSALTESLSDMGISVSTDQSGGAIPSDTDLFVYSEAIPESAPERQEAGRMGLHQLSYPEALGQISKGYRTIAVCGTHGKSSTTAMTGRLLLETGRDPSIIVGTKMRELDGRNWRKGASNLFLIEACEYMRSFLNYTPSIILLTTCDGDHFDYYTSQQDYESAFTEFFDRLPPDGIIIIHGNDPICYRLAHSSGRRVLDADSQPMLSLQTPGKHMRQNAQLALALAEVLDIPAPDARLALSGYAGSWRRLETKGITAEGATVIDDYAHHPAEIRATISAIIEAYPGKRIIGVFQPHTHDRTKKLYQQFVSSFGGLSSLIIPNIYNARSDRGAGAVDVDDFAKDIAEHSKVETMNGMSLEATISTLRSLPLQRTDVVLCMGAGDITSLANALVSRS